MCGEVGSFFKSWVMHGFGPGSWQDLGGALVKSWASPGHLGRLLGSSWAALGLSWAALGLLLGRLGRQAGAFKGVLKAAWRHLGGNWTRKWSQVGIKVE